MFDDAGLWFGVVAIGAYHGLNPAMGWPLAVANGLSETPRRRRRGHLRPARAAAICWRWPWCWCRSRCWRGCWTGSREMRIGAGALVLLFGLSRLFGCAAIRAG